MRPRRLLLGLVFFVASAVSAAVDTSVAVLWPEHQRAFIQDAPSLLLSDEQKEEFLTASSEERDQLIESFYQKHADPESGQSKLLEGIEQRTALVRQEEFLGFSDDRARLLFLHGQPTSREIVDCGQTFVPLEIWTYGTADDSIEPVLYQPVPDGAFRLWMPSESKRVLYNREMVYWLEQWEELRGLIRAKRFDLQICDGARLVDKATGVEGLRDFQKNRPTDRQMREFMSPPADLAVWAEQAARTPLSEVVAELELNEVKILFPERIRQRMVTRFLISIPSAAGLGRSTEEGEPGLALAVQGVIEQRDKIFDEFRVRFKLEPPEEDRQVALVLERSLRPDREFVAHLEVIDEVKGTRAYVSRGFAVPEEAQVIAEPPVPEGTIIAMGEQLSQQVIPGSDSLLLVPPATDVLLGLWRAEALVTGSRIVKVRFLVDEQTQMTRNGRPFTAELRLAEFPVEQIIRAEGYDESGELVAADEVIINQPRGALRVRILEPARGAAVSGSVVAKVEVVVPEERRVESVEFKVNEMTVATLDRPPWETQIEVPAGGSMSYLAVTATLDDGSRSEEVRFLNSPQYLEEVDVKLVELFTTVTDKSGRLVRGLPQEDFQVTEDGRPQTISKFELVEDLPLSLGIVIDTSGSMADSLAEAKEAALGFLENIITLKDSVFALSFSDKPELLIPPTDDVEAVEEALDDLISLGWTTLHDAVVTSLYYFRGVRGRRALILLSDGDDTASAMAFRDALEYARRSGVAIYTIGLGVGSLKMGVRNKLTELSKETGGRTFFIGEAEELVSVYQEIEEELRSQYLIAYASDRPTPDESFRQVEVKVKGGRLKARTISGYYP